MTYVTTGNPAEIDVRFLGYRLDVISRWPSSARKLASARAISRRLTAIARSALVRPDIEDLLHLSCRLLDDVFTAGESAEASSAIPVSLNSPPVEPSGAAEPQPDWC
jgi:hypothetical protein